MQLLDDRNRILLERVVDRMVVAKRENGNHRLWVGFNNCVFSIEHGKRGDVATKDLEISSNAAVPRW